MRLSMHNQKKSMDNLGTAVAELNIAAVEQRRPVDWQQDGGVLHSSLGKYTRG